MSSNLKMERSDKSESYRSVKSPNGSTTMWSSRHISRCAYFERAVALNCHPRSTHPARLLQPAWFSRRSDRLQVPDEPD